MKQTPIRLVVAAIALFAFASFVAAQKKPLATQPKYHYVLSRITADGQNNWMNWDENWDWDRKITRDELWLKHGDKTYLVTDKQTMDEFQRAFGPKMEFDKQRSKYMDGYYSAKAQVKSCRNQGRGIDRQIQGIERRMDNAKSEEDRQELRNEVKKLEGDKKNLERQADEWNKKLEAETSTREEFYEKREVLRAQAYKITDRIAEEAIANGIAKEAVAPMAKRRN